MSSTEIVFKVVEETNCPFYKADDEFKLSGNALSLELDREQTFISTAIVTIQGPDFKEIINKFPSVQMYLARLLTKRLAESNVLRTEENNSGMSGDLSQMSAIELLQALELSQKSGKLTLILPQGSAQLLIKSGNLIRADYCNKAGKEAVFEILKEREGRFTFNPDLPKDQMDAPKIGSLMEILLDASRMIDEEGGDYECGSFHGAMQADNL